MQLPDPMMIYAYVEQLVHKCAIIHNHNQSQSQRAAAGEAITQFVNIIRSDSDALHATLSCAICHTSSGDIGRRLLACHIRIRNTYTCSYGD